MVLPGTVVLSNRKPAASAGTSWHSCGAQNSLQRDILCFFCYFHTSQVRNTHHQVTSGRPKFITPSLKIYRYVIKFHSYVITGYRRFVNAICAILGFYAAWNGSFLPTFRDNISVPSSRVKHSAWPLKMWPTGFPETTVRNYNSKLRSIPKKHRSQVLLTSQQHIP
jgi:hypothetical protein